MALNMPPVSTHCNSGLGNTCTFATFAALPCLDLASYQLAATFLLVLNVLLGLMLKHASQLSFGTLVNISIYFTGEMERHSGLVRMGGSLAYVAQQAWIVNDSLQSNVLFGQQLDEQRWEACVHACSLQQDLEVSFMSSKPAFGICTTEAL